MQRARKLIEADFMKKEPWMEQGVTVAVLDTGERVIILLSQRNPIKSRGSSDFFIVRKEKIMI